MPYCRAAASVIRVVGPFADFQCSSKGIEPFTSDVDALSCREPPSEIKRDPTQLIRCGIGMDLDKIPNEF